MARANSVRKLHAGGHDAPTPARMVGLPSREGSTFFRRERKYQRKQAARRLQRRPTSLCTAAKPCAALGLGYALHGFQPFLALVGLRPWASICGNRTVGRPEFIRVVQFRPKGRNSLITFREQTALRGCPRARGVRCRIAPCRSLCSPPTLPAGRFGLRPRPHWGHASLRDSSLRSPAGKKPFIAHFAGGARNVARNLVGQLTPSTVRAPVLIFFRRQNGRAFFPPLPIAALLHRGWRLANSKECQLGCFDVI